MTRLDLERLEDTESISDEHEEEEKVGGRMMGKEVSGDFFFW